MRYLQGNQQDDHAMHHHYPDFDDHALITSRYDAHSGLSALIAIHNDTRGPAIGGCRIIDYQSFDSAMTDVLRLSRGMTYKTAIAGIPYGGGKAVIIADPARDKTTGLLEAFGDFVESLGGRYITSFDSGTTLADIETIATRTSFAAGTLAEAGNASGTTAQGIYHCMRAAADIVHGSPDLSGMTVAVQGVGNVGARLADRLARDGVLLIVADANEARAREVADSLGAKWVAADRIDRTTAHIFAPCALGAVLSTKTIPDLSAQIVVGGANNQLATPDCDELLRRHGILYCPDYLANAGGIIDLHYQRSAWNAEAVETHVASLADTFVDVAERACAQGRGTAAVADEIAQERFARPRTSA
ncbi:Glu/Leu/Phe/Val dehydrogenase dimerization domain-containing protein [Blastomonas fulva]|uniref:Glu/Leu/Phe/Val dehydrogenase dimerization domain-containing protein n=1 Tax=Blastomonas fulva TaxID=1550728 RepID=UPI003D2CB5E7